MSLISLTRSTAPQFPHPPQQTAVRVECMRWARGSQESQDWVEGGKEARVSAPFLPLPRFPWVGGAEYGQDFQLAVWKNSLLWQGGEPPG